MRLNIILISILISILIYNIFNKTEHFTDNKNAFCLLTRTPNVIWLDFLTNCTNDYDVYIVVDNILEDYSEFINKFPNINFVIISDEECQSANYYNSDFMFKPIVATDRAYYFFNKNNKKYPHIWFCEDDVFFENINMLKNLDNKYPNADIISSKMEINNKGIEETRWHWQTLYNRNEIKFTPPLANAMMCLTRFSNDLMQKLHEYVIKYNTLDYKEFLFHTIAIHNNMNIETPAELENITWNNTFNNLNPKKEYDQIYHPVKDLELHVKNRNL